MNNILEVNNVSKSFGKFKALSDISINVPKNSIFGLLGPNGAGKTTLIRIINQITLPDFGSVKLDGELLCSRHVQNIGYLPEERGLYKSMKVSEQALYLAQLKGLSYNDAKKRLNYWFEKLQISHWWDKKVQELSKGMAQKIQFIVTVMHQPKLLIFDEPFSGFDPINANVIKDEILQLRDEGATVIFSTHRMESIEAMCDHIALINESKKILDGKLVDIKRTHKTNSFEVGLVSKNKSALKRLISQYYDIDTANFKSIEDDLKLNIHLSLEQSSDDLLSFLSQNSSVKHFKELIPSVDDIFTKTVKNN
jgi:ABC-2 type transport system ATP-binding protein